MIFDTNGTSNDKIAMGKMMAWSVPHPKENQIAKTTNTELFLIGFRSGFSRCAISSAYLCCWRQGTKIERLNSTTK